MESSDKQRPRIRMEPGKVTLIPNVKVLTMGEGATGKSCLVKRYCERKFVSRYIATIGVDYGVKSVVVRGEQFRVNFWDLSGHPEYLEVRNEFYKDSQAILLVFDVSNLRSFEKLDAWLRECRTFGASSAHIVVAGNKADLKKRVIPKEMAQEWCTTHKLPYFETSCKTGLNIDALFLSIFETLANQLGSSSTK